MMSGILSGVVSSSGNVAVIVNRVLLAIGQSNILRLFLNAESQVEAGLNAADPTPAWQFLSAAADGSSLFQANAASQTDPTNYWIATGGGIGTRWQQALDLIAGYKAANKAIPALILNQGEGDGGYNATLANVDAWGNGWLTVIASLSAAAGGTVRCFWVPMNRRGDGTQASQAGYTNMRRKIVQLCAANPSILTLMPEMYDQDTDGGAHTTPAGYIALAPRDFRKINKVNGLAVSGGVDGPRIVSAARNGATVTATLVHDGGTDITPTTAIQGATYFIDGVEYPISNVARVDATTISGTLASNPAQGASELFYYGYGTLPVVTDYTKMLRDNQTVPLPVRFAEITPTVTGAGSSRALVSSVLPNVVADYRAADTSGQTVPNAQTTPADGAAKTDYNIFLGSTSGTGEANEPTFVAAAGGVPAYLNNKGTDVLQQPATTTFMRNLANGNSFTLVYLIKAPSSWGTAVAYLLQAGATTATVPGLSIRYVASSTQYRLSTSDGTTLDNGAVTVAGLPTTGYHMLGITINDATGAYQIFLDDTLVTSGTLTARKTGVQAAGGAFNFFNAFPSGSGFIDAVMFNDIKTTANMTTLKNFWQTLEGITIG